MRQKHSIGLLTTGRNDRVRGPYRAIEPHPDYWTEEIRIRCLCLVEVEGCFDDCVDIAIAWQILEETIQIFLSPHERSSV